MLCAEFLHFARIWGYPSPPGSMRMSAPPKSMPGIMNHGLVGMLKGLRIMLSLNNDFGINLYRITLYV